ncbi:hypothetical protein [Acinetobacter sp. SWBY1]|uniref:hypothetical protein n=1 Tax=Acinetobacter sp. SWBY1 TaxID=2079596 RepID=UPI001BC890B7|nr:hypothetical protein [Acinetobacter sp. SWBY1]
MALFSTAWHLVGIFFVFLLGALIALSIRRLFYCNPVRTLALYCWHAFFSIVYAIYVVNKGGDATRYYNNSLLDGTSFAFGTRGIEFFTSFFSQGLGLSLLGTFFVFQIFGFIGLLAFDAALREVTKNKTKKTRQLASLIVFLPSISFWSAAIGKDSLSFMATGLALWAALKLNKRIATMAVAILVMLFVRPHIAAMMVIALAGSFVFQSNIPTLQRIFFGSIALVSTVMLVPFALNYTGIGDNAGAEEVMTYIEGRQAENLSGGSSVDIANMSLPMQLFTYLFRPIIFEARSIFSLLAAIDNLILLYLFVIGFKAVIKKPLPIHLLEHNRMFLWIYSLLAWFILASTTANLGIAIRQKWMFTPILIFLLISLIGKERKMNKGDNLASNKLSFRKRNNL